MTRLLRLFVYSHLSEEGHSEVGAQQPFAGMHHLHHFGVGAVQSVIQVCQFLFCKDNQHQ